MAEVTTECAYVMKDYSTYATKLYRPYLSHNTHTHTHTHTTNSHMTNFT